MPTTECEQGLWPIRFKWQDGDEIGYFDGCLPLFGASAGDLSNMGETRPISLQIGTQFLTLVGEAGKQMGGISFSRPGSPHGFAIDGEGISGRGEGGSSDPRREHLFNGLSTDLRK